MQDLTVHPVQPADQDWVREITIQNWGSEQVVLHHAMYLPHQLPGWIARRDGDAVGLLTYHIDAAACEIVTLDSFQPRQGVGTTLLHAVRRSACQAGCRRLWLITTNDNLTALGFYQKYGFQLCGLYCGAVQQARKIKPEIPLLGENGIPIRDELELEIWL